MKERDVKKVIVSLVAVFFLSGISAVVVEKAVAQVKITDQLRGEAVKAGEGIKGDAEKIAGDTKSAAEKKITTEKAVAEKKVIEKKNAVAKAIDQAVHTVK